MRFNTFAAAAAAAAISVAATAASANDLGVFDPNTVSAPIYGSSDVVTMVQPAGAPRAETVAPVDYVPAETPLEGDTLDMSGADGTLRACYAAGGMAKQREDFSYFCTYDVGTSVASGTQTPTTESAYVVPAGVETGYNGTKDIQNEALIDCVERGGSLIQLASNQNFACAM